MRRGLLLVALILVMKLRSTQSRCGEETASRRASSSDQNTGLGKLQRGILKRYGDLDYDSFVGLMGRRSADPNAVPSPQKREMHDLFFGLMGRRNAEPDNGLLKENPETRGVFLSNKCKLRYRRGL